MSRKPYSTPCCRMALGLLVGLTASASADDVGVVRLREQPDRVVRGQSPGAGGHDAVLQAECAEEQSRYFGGAAFGRWADDDCRDGRIRRHGRWGYDERGRRVWVDGTGTDVWDRMYCRADAASERFLLGLCRRCGFLSPTGGDGAGVPLIGHYKIVYPVDPYYFDGRDGQVYSAPGYNAPVTVPLAPVVRSTYNYGWGIPSSRLTPISRPVP